MKNKCPHSKRLRYCEKCAQGLIEAGTHSQRFNLELLEAQANDERTGIPERLALIYQIYQIRGIRNGYLAEVQ